MLLFIISGCTSKDNSVDTPFAESQNELPEENIQDVNMQNEEIQEDYPADDNIPDEKIRDENISEVNIQDENIQDANNKDTISIIMVGDMLLHDRIEKYSMNEDGSYDFSAIFENVSDEISSADIAIANQEVIIGGEQLGISGYPAFNAPYEFADELAEAGFDVICHGSNHALDKGGKGITNCLEYWANKHPEIEILGIHDSVQDQDSICIYSLENPQINIAILNYTYGTNGISLPENMPYAVDYLSEERVIADLQKAEEMADFTIVCPHWGTEYSLEANASQQKWAELMVENGADLIIGTHPHVIEPVEMIDNTPVYYSIGNFVNWTSGEGAGVSNRMVGGIACIELGVEKDNLSINHYDVIPIVSHVTSMQNGVTVYRLDEYTDELAGKNEIIKQAPDFSLLYCNELVEKIWGEFMD